jgi:hypothetical protein
LVGKSKKQEQHQKQNPLGKRERVSSLRRIRVPKEPSAGEKCCANGLDKADFLIDGLSYRRASGAWRIVLQAALSKREVSDIMLRTSPFKGHFGYGLEESPGCLR